MSTGVEEGEKRDKLEVEKREVEKREENKRGKERNEMRV